MLCESRSDQNGKTILGLSVAKGIKAYSLRKLYGYYLHFTCRRTDKGKKDT